MRAGQSIFVRGGTGGVGSMVIQMAKAAGANVITTAGSPEKAEECRKLGADHVVEYKKADTQQAVLEAFPTESTFFGRRCVNPTLTLPCLV